VSQWFDRTESVRAFGGRRRRERRRAAHLLGDLEVRQVFDGHFLLIGHIVVVHSLLGRTE
jgi:hypothetical protein